MSKNIRLDKNILKKCNSFLFDCDGVLWKQNNLLPGALDIIKMLRSLNKRVILISNNSTISSEQYVEKCAKLNLPVDSNSIVSASNVFANYLKLQNFTGKIYVIGEEGIQTELNKVGIQCIGVGEENRYFRDLVNNPENFDPEVKAVVIGFDTKFNLSKMTLASSYISCQNCKFYATNADAVFPTKSYLIPGTGSMVKAVETAAGVKPIITGKPYPPMMTVLKEKYKIIPEETIMIGDNLYTDITFGNVNKMTTLLVFTGVTAPKDILVIPPNDDAYPKFYCDTLNDLIDILK